MAKGKSNPKTVERVKGMTKAMRNEMERAEAEAAATEAAARSAKERKKGRRARDASSDEDEDESAENATLTQNNKQSKGNKVQIGGFGIGCRGTGNEKARRLKEEHDEKMRKKKATKARLAAERSAAAARDGYGVDDDDKDESWRVRNPTVNKKANRGKQKRGKKERDDDDDDDDDENENVTRLSQKGRSNDERVDDADDDSDDQNESTSPFLRGSSGASFPAARAAAASAFSLLRGDDDEEEDDEDDAEENNTDDEKTKKDVDDDDSDADDDSERKSDSVDGLLSTTDRLTDLVLDDDATADFSAERDGAVEDVVDANAAHFDATSESESESSASDWETDEEKDADASPNPFASLFDAHESETVEQNLEYMRVKHGFVVPYRDSLADEEGFVNYLRRKIVRRKQCLFCQKRFLTLEGVRGHMRDAGHVRVRFEPPAVFRGNPLFDEAIARANADGYEPEYGEFYDFGNGPGNASIQSAENGDACGGTSALFDSNRVGGGLELVLRDKHGRTKQLGHRSFRRYYKQKFRNDYVARGSKADEKRVAAAAPAARLAERERNKQVNAIATRSMRVALRGASKALAAQFTTKAGFADNAARRAIVHHWGAGGGGSHYHTAGSKQFLKGVRIKGVVSRHSKQGAKMQAARVQAARNKQNRGNASVAVLRSGTRKG
jgi:pre-60S factor REI1